jgi:hypothetical protein
MLRHGQTCTGRALDAQNNRCHRRSRRDVHHSVSDAEPSSSSGDSVGRDHRCSVDRKPRRERRLLDALWALWLPSRVQLLSALLPALLPPVPLLSVLLSREQIGEARASSRTFYLAGPHFRRHPAKFVLAFVSWPRRGRSAAGWWNRSGREPERVEQPAANTAGSPYKRLSVARQHGDEGHEEAFLCLGRSG